MYVCMCNYVCVLYGVPFVKNIQLEYMAPEMKG